MHSDTTGLGSATADTADMPVKRRINQKNDLARQPPEGRQDDSDQAGSQFKHKVRNLGLG
eukprot:4098049-Alexandrium_andersonii.AAC.1